MVRQFKNSSELYKLGPGCHERMLPIASSKLDILRNRGVAFAGISDLNETYEVGRQNPLCHHLLYTLEGRGWVKTKGVNAVLEPGDVWFSPKKLPHQFGLKGQSWKMLWWSFKDATPWSMIRTVGPVVRPSIFGERFKPIMEELFQSTQMKSPHSQKAIRLLSELALLYLEWELDTSSDDQGHMITNRLAQLFEKVRAQLQLSWTVEALQEASGLYYSTDHFSRICSQYLGMTPMQKVIQLRMERSQELLLNTKFTLQIISGLVGYQDSFSFSAAFKRWSGLSPREFRKRSDGAS